MPLLTRLGAVVVLFVIYDTTYGSLTLVLNDKPLSVSAVLGRGAVWSVLMVFFNLTYLPYQRRRRREQGAAGEGR